MPWPEQRRRPMALSGQAPEAARPRSAYGRIYEVFVTGEEPRPVGVGSRAETSEGRLI